MADGALRSPLDKGAGILRSRVPEWLSVSPLKEMVLKVEPAKPAHGGDGALVRVSEAGQGLTSIRRSRRCSGIPARRTVAVPI
jgi:hypothetical protein